MDLVAGSAIGATAPLRSVQSPTLLLAFATGAAITGSVANGWTTFTGEGSASLAAAAGVADAATRIADGTSEGRTVLFTTGGNDFIFVQGGTAAR